LTKQLDEERRKTSQVQDSLDAAQHESQTFRTDIAILKKKLSSAEDECTRLRKHAIQASAESEDTVLQLKEQVDTLLLTNQNNSEIVARSKDQERELQALRTEITTKSAETDTLQGLIQQLQHDQQQEIEIRTLHLTHQTKLLETQKTTLEKQVVDLQSQLDEALQFKRQNDEAAIIITAKKQRTRSRKTRSITYQSCFGASTQKIKFRNDK